MKRRSRNDLTEISTENIKNCAFFSICACHSCARRGYVNLRCDVCVFVCYCVGVLVCGSSCCGSIEVPVRILRPVMPVWICVFPLGFYVVPPLGFCVAESLFLSLGLEYMEYLACQPNIGPFLRLCVNCYELCGCACRCADVGWGSTCT